PYICLKMRYIKLKPEEIETLAHLFETSSNSTVRKRSQCLLLSRGAANHSP
ncbi:hypothetical protein EZS27_029480, partial [termite gut metagenome]